MGCVGEAKGDGGGGLDVDVRGIRLRPPSRRAVVVYDGGASFPSPHIKAAGHHPPAALITHRRTRSISCPDARPTRPAI
jgi:hypothetical protein